MLTLQTLKIGGRYNWKHQPERLVYVGMCEPRNGRWHQFERVDEPGKVWCEVLTADLHMLEETPSAPGVALPAGGGEQHIAAARGEPLRHATKDNGDCPHWCKACAAERAARGVLAVDGRQTSGGSDA